MNRPGKIRLARRPPGRRGYVLVTMALTSAGVLGVAGLAVAVFSEVVVKAHLRR